MDSITSFLHSSFPELAVSPNILASQEYEEFPGLQGTGFFCSKNGFVFYVTARHCLTKDDKKDIAQFAEMLRIPYGQSTDLTRKTVAFDAVLSVRHQSEDLPGTYLDIVAFQVSIKTPPELLNLLMHRAVRLPPTGNWFVKFLESEVAKPAYELGRGIPLIGIGFPHSDSYARVQYPEDEVSLTQISVQSVRFRGEVSPGVYPDRVKLNNIDWGGDMDGLSGSPVFIKYIAGDAEAFALAGIFVTAGGGGGQLIRIDILSELFKHV